MSTSLLPVVPTRHVWLLVWGAAPGAALLCLARGMEHAAMLSLAGNAAAALSSLGLLAVFVRLIATGAGARDPAPVLASLEAWDEVDSIGSRGLQGVPIPAAALACCASGFMVHFTLPALEAAMTSPRRAMEAITRAFLLSALVLCVFGALGAAGAGANAPRNALDAAGKGLVADLLRLLAAVDALTTAPVLVRPALLVLESQWERASGVKLQTAGAGILRCAFVVAAAAAAAAAPQGVFAAAMPLLCGGAAVVCTLVLPPLLLLLGADATGEPLVRSGGAERGAAGAIVCLGVGCLLFTGMAFAGAFKVIPFPYNAPPAPPSEAEYDYNNDYTVAERYAFTHGRAVTTTDGEAELAGAAQQVMPVPHQPPQAPQAFRNLTLYPDTTAGNQLWSDRGAAASAAASAAAAGAGGGGNATAAGNGTAAAGGWHPGQVFNPSTWNPSMYHPPETATGGAAAGATVVAPGAGAAGAATTAGAAGPAAAKAAPVVLAPATGSGASGASSDD